VIDPCCKYVRDETPLEEEIDCAIDRADERDLENPKLSNSTSVVMMHAPPLLLRTGHECIMHASKPPLLQKRQLVAICKFLFEEKI
jgi:hypothetical protein